MLNTFETLVVFAAGAALAWGFCLHLNWCLQRLEHVRAPYGFWSLHWLIRIGGVLAGFYLMASGDAARMLICLAGFVLMRLWLTHNAAQTVPATNSFK